MKSLKSIFLQPLTKKSWVQNLFEKSLSKENLWFIKLYINCGGDILKKWNNNNSLMHYACRVHPLYPEKYQKKFNFIFNHCRIQDNLEKLINSQNLEGFTPLHMAVQSQSLDVIKKLLEISCIKINTANHQGMTALLLACKTINMNIISNNDITLEIAKLLIDAGADIDHKDTYSGRDALGHAITRHHFTLVKLLIEKGANLLNFKPNDVCPLVRIHAISQDLFFHMLSYIAPEDLDRHINTIEQSNVMLKKNVLIELRKRKILFEKNYLEKNLDSKESIKRIIKI